MAMRPSCGSRFSAMFSPAMIFSRETRAACRGLNPAGTGTVCNKPSMRYFSRIELVVRFQVNVRGVQAQRFQEDLIDEVGDGRVNAGRRRPVSRRRRFPRPGRPIRFSARSR
jgi:hypothetical protein